MICVVVHELGERAAPDALDPWELTAAAQKHGEVTVLHTGPVGAVASGAYRTRAQAAGMVYRHLDEDPIAFPVPVFPAVEAHRIGLRVAHSPALLRADEIWFVGAAGHAAAVVAARRTDWFGFAGRRSSFEPALRLFVSTLAEYERTRARRFPDGGREGMAGEFLERRAVAGVDAVHCLSPELRDWVAAARGRDGVVVLLRSGQAIAALPRVPAAERTLPRVTVCVTYYEKADYLKEALDSLSVQSPRPHEVIVIDDGSTSAAAQEAWKKAGDRYWALGWKFLRQENAGPSAARNRAAAEATGDAVLFCDADNRFRPGMVGTLARALAASGADCVTCAFQTFRADAGEAATHIFAPLGPCAEGGLIENVLGDTTTLFRRDAFLASGGFRPGLVNEDWRLLLDWLQQGRSMETVPAILFDYRVAATSRSTHESEFASAAAVILPLWSDQPALARLWPHAAGSLRDDRAARLAAELAPARADLTRLGLEAAACEAARVQAERNRAAAESALAAVRSETETAMLALQRETEATLAGFRQEEAERNARQRILDRMRRGHIVLLEAAAAQRQQEAELARTAASSVRRELTAAVEAAARQRAAADGEIAALRGRLGRVEGSFSWKVTAPLRALRRATLDRWRRRRAAAPAAQTLPPAGLTLASHLDAPRLWSGLEGTVTVRGWCFATAGGQVVEVRGRVGARTYPGVYGGERPDLPRHFPATPASGFSGFKIDVALLPDDERLVLEAGDGQGRWQAFLERGLGADEAPGTGTYAHWRHAYPDPDDAALTRLRAAAAALPRRLISVLLPVYNSDERWLRRALDSVLAQVYPHWELCVADDASTAPQVAAVLDEYAARDARIRVRRRPVNGHISAATNTALEMAGGDFAALLDHDDELAPHALLAIAREIAAHAEAALIYTDEDKIDEQGARFDPHFKPDWNPELLASQNYLSHLAVYRTELLRELGGLRVGFEGCQDWDLALRATARLAAERIRHVPLILYHWRAAEGSTALHLGEKQYVSERARRALQEHFERQGEAVTVEPAVGGHWHVTHLLPDDRPHPLVSIIIPTRNAGRMVQLCLASIFARTRYAPYEVILVDNRSDDPESLALFEAASRDDDVRVLRYDAPFNYSALNNFAAQRAHGDVLCLLNNDIEVLEPTWLDELVGQAMRPGIGAVGARLYYPDLRVQHAGVITGLGGVAGHPFKHFERSDPGTPQFRPHLTQNVSAVTGACLVIRRETYLAVGGLDEEALPIAFNDVDFCLKVRATGLRNVYCPAAELIHHESASRGAENTPEKVLRFQSEIAAIQARWGERLLNDPAYNPNLTLDREDFGLAYPPRAGPLDAV